MIEGRYYDGRTSAPQAAQLAIGADRIVRVLMASGERLVPLASVRISDRIGNIPRRIAFEDGAVFETGDNDALDAALDVAGRRGFARHLVRLERRWTVAVAALAAVALVSWLFVVHGVPRLAAAAARAMPPAVNAAIASEGLELLDRTMLGPSELPSGRQEALRERLRAMTAELQDGFDYRLEVRRGRRVGPNAFALPSGIIVVTDELVRLAEREEEIDAVLAHEVGHVRGRHALRMLLQDAGVAALALAVLGDVGTASSLAAAVPVILIQAKHSRDFEREADRFARQWLRDRGLPDTHFDTMMCRLDRAGEPAPYLSTHPPLEERARCD